MILLKADSVVLTEQIRTIDKSRLKEKIGHIDDAVVMGKINSALGVSFRVIVTKKDGTHFFSVPSFFEI